ncbi:MAG: protein kinase domain-containing protein [Gemmatimonadaceae bacterium]
MTAPRTTERHRSVTRSLPPHLAGWELPPGWRWGAEGNQGDYRYYQEVLDGLGRSLSLVTTPDPAHYRWLHAEAVKLAHRSHPSIPTTYHYWTAMRERGPGYLRRWVSGETVGTHFERLGAADVPYVLRVLRGAGSTLAYVHDLGSVHGALSANTLWTTPTGRLWMLEWQWAVGREDIPAGLRPDLRALPRPPEWQDDAWRPTPETDQWQLAAICFTMLTGEAPPPHDTPPVKLLRPETPESVARAIDRALLPDPAERFPSMAAMIRAAERGYAAQLPSGQSNLASDAPRAIADEDERLVRDAVGDDYEILSKLGSGTFGTVWRARDLALEREVALKMLHPRVARDGNAVSAFWREARLAAQLAHPAIVPISDWDGKAGMSWYTMELAEGGSVAQLVARRGARAISNISSQVELILDGLAAAHSIGVVHRDLKHENILIDRYQRWRLTDFGIANASGEEVSAPAGTLGFSAPEQSLGEPQSAAVDLFALAAIVAYVLTGELPFPGSDPQAVLARQLGERVDLSVLPAAVAAWLQTGLAPSPADRFRDAAAMQLQWRSAVAGALKRERARRWWRSLLPTVQR